MYVSLDSKHMENGIADLYNDFLKKRSVLCLTGSAVPNWECAVALVRSDKPLKCFAVALCSGPDKPKQRTGTDSLL